MPDSTRLTFPEDRTAFVFQHPGQPILTPPRVGLQLFLDQAGTQLADIQTLIGDPIAFATIYIQDDALYPEFLGPEGFVHLLWGRVIGGLARTYPVFARYSDQLANFPTLLSGDGPPSPTLGVVGSYYIDQALPAPGDPNGTPQPVLYGPRTLTGWPATGVPLVGPQGPSASNQEYQVPIAIDTWDITHRLSYRPSVTTFDSAYEEMKGDVSWPAPNRVIVRFGRPVSGSAILT